jgi:hypothetical protein
MIASNCEILDHSFLRATTRSPRTVQQMQPFMTSMTSSSAFSLRIFSSTPTEIQSALHEVRCYTAVGRHWRLRKQITHPRAPSPNSFSIMAKRNPWFGSSRMWFSSVVLPEPRKPVRIVTGTLRRAFFADLRRQSLVTDGERTDERACGSSTCTWDHIPSWLAGRVGSCLRACTVRCGSVSVSSAQPTVQPAAAESKVSQISQMTSSLQ